MANTPLSLEAINHWSARRIQTRLMHAITHHAKGQLYFQTTKVPKSAIEIELAALASPQHQKQKARQQRQIALDRANADRAEEQKSTEQWRQELEQFKSKLVRSQDEVKRLTERMRQV